MLCNEYPVFCTLEFQRTILFNFTLQLTFVDVVINRNGIFIGIIIRSSVSNNLKLIFGNKFYITLKFLTIPKL